MSLNNSSRILTVRKPSQREQNEVAWGFTDLLPTIWMLLVVAALIDWLVTRTVTRFAIFIPKTPAMITGYVALTWFGQVGSTLAALVALLGIVVIVVWDACITRRWWLAAPLAMLAALTVAAPFSSPALWLPGYYLLALTVLLVLTVRAAGMVGPRTRRLAVLLPALAMTSAMLSQAAPTYYVLLHWPGPPAWGLPLFRSGETFVLFGAALLWGGYGRGANWRSWSLGGMLTAAFVAAYLAAPAMTATMVIWSHGLTFSLPWWLYAVALLLFSTTVAHCLRNGQRQVAWALLLLIAAGYAPQMSSQFWFGVIALWLITHEFMPNLRSGLT